MTDDPKPRPASPKEVIEALSFALRFDGRKPFPQASSRPARTVVGQPFGADADPPPSQEINHGQSY